MQSQPRLVRFSGLLIAIASAACSGPAIGWRGVEASEDPEPPVDPELRSYKESHYRDLGTRIIATATEEQVVAAARRARVLFLGDHHRHAALHRRHLTLLARLAGDGVPIVLALEAIGVQDQPDVDAFLGGRFDLDELCERIARRWPDSWLGGDEVDAGYYRALLAFARRTSTPATALEPTPRIPLEMRDREISARIGELLRGVARDRLLVVVVGHTHLLGDGDLVGRTDATAVVLGARMSTSLSLQTDGRDDPTDVYLRSDRDVLFPPEAR